MIAVIGTSAPLWANPPAPDFANWWDPCHNCYNYALNGKTTNAGATRYFPNPGRIGTVAVPIPPLTEAQIRAESMLDGLTDVGTVPWVAGSPVPAATDCPTGSCLVAFEYRPGSLAAPGMPAVKPDYHWFRLNADGTWSGKPGNLCARRLKKLDGTNATNPETANRSRAGGATYTFGGYMCVPTTRDFTSAGMAAWVNSGVNATCWGLSSSGFSDRDQSSVVLSGIQIEELVSHLPTGGPIPNPGWDDLPPSYDDGIAVLPDDGAHPSLPPFLRVFDGAVAYYSALQSPLTITYYMDDNGLEGYLRGIPTHAVPTVSGWGLIVMTLLGLSAATILGPHRRPAFALVDGGLSTGRSGSFPSFQPPQASRAKRTNERVSKIQRSIMTLAFIAMCLPDTAAFAQVLFEDHFDDGIVPSRYQVIPTPGSADLSEPLGSGRMNIEYLSANGGMSIDFTGERPNCIKFDFNGELHLPTEPGASISLMFVHDTSVTPVPEGFKKARVSYFRQLPPADTSKYRVILSLLDADCDVLPGGDVVLSNQTIPDDKLSKLGYDIVGNQVRVEYYDGTSWVVLHSVDPPDIQPIIGVELTSSTTAVPPTMIESLQAELIHNPSVVPTVSQWGLVVMALIGLSTGTIVFSRRRVASA